MPLARSRPGALALAAATLLAALLFLVAGGAADPAPGRAADLGEKLEQTEGQLEETQQRKGVLTSTISRFGDRIEALTGQVEAIRGREAEARERLVARQAELGRARAALVGAEAKLVRARSHLKVAVGVLNRHLIAIYESGSPDVLSVIVGSSGMEDLAARTEYLDRIAAMDEAVVGRVRDLRNEVRDLVVSRLNSKVQIERARDYIAGFAQNLEESRSTLESRQGDLLAARDGREAALADISAHEEELDGSVESIQAQIAEQLRETGSVPLPPGVVANADEMIWPVEGPIASPFGGRDIGAGYEYHPGIDIAVPEGTPIKAALAGTVAFTEPEESSGGYGNYTCIDHGGGLSTCYAHQTRFGVTAGESVQQGQIIGWTGCTGYCLGPHLHFEVRIFGEVTDPMGYL